MAPRHVVSCTPSTCGLIERAPRPPPPEDRQPARLVLCDKKAKDFYRDWAAHSPRDAVGKLRQAGRRYPTIAPNLKRVDAADLSRGSDDLPGRDGNPGRGCAPTPQGRQAFTIVGRGTRSGLDCDEVALSPADPGGLHSGTGILQPSAAWAARRAAVADMHLRQCRA